MNHPSRTPPAPLPMPMFPLGTVLFPRQPLPLHIFEQRYRQLTADCLQSGNEFGVVLIERGSEVGGGDVRFAMGTVARIVEAARLPDGRWAMLAVGARRIRVDCWLPDDPYPLAMVEEVRGAWLPEADVGLLKDAERAVRRSLAMAAELGDQGLAPATFHLGEDPDEALWQLCSIAPIPQVDRQGLLELPDSSERLNRLAGLIGEAAEVLAHRLAGG